jgi:hypothetical protein
VDDTLRSASPVQGMAGYGRYSAQHPHARDAKRDTEDRAECADAVSLHGGRTLGLRLLRERVLARTRTALGFPAAVASLPFAEITDGEPVGAFLGRLLSAQNLLAGLMAIAAPGAHPRELCDAAFRDGAEETLELLTRDDRPDLAALDVVGEVLAEFARRLAC